MMQMPIPICGCPSRRAHAPYPHFEEAPYNSGKPPFVVRADYAINHGSTLHGWVVIRQRAVWLRQGDDPAYPDWLDWLKDAPPLGISFMRSEVAMRHDTDGTSNTYLVGEKHVNPDHYRTGNDGGDNENMYCGYIEDNGRYTLANVPPNPGSSGA